MYQVINAYGKYEYYDFNQNGYVEYRDYDIIVNDGLFISTTNDCTETIFYYWKEIEITRSTVQSIQDEQYTNLTLSYWYINKFECSMEKSELKFYIKSQDLPSLIRVYSERNEKMALQRKSVLSLVDDYTLQIAENLLNMADANIMLDDRVVALCHIRYSHILDDKNRKLFDEGQFYSTGKERIEAEKYNHNLHSIFNNFANIINNFIEIIREEKNIDINVAGAVAWESIQRKSIEYYAKKWLEEYEINLEKSFDEMHKDLNSQADITVIESNYIKSVMLYDEINIEDVKEILIYFLLSKKNTNEIILYDYFMEYYRLINKIKKNLQNLNIKQKLKIPQNRKDTKYTINDVDLMNGFEFEEFIALLFKKMGYMSQITKKSGDQGLDVIVERNNKRIGIQTKCYSVAVGNAAIQEAVAGKNFYNCNKVMVITNNYFTSSAIKLAQSNNVILWNRDFLKEKIKELI